MGLWIFGADFSRGRALEAQQKKKRLNNLAAAKSERRDAWGSMITKVPFEPEGQLITRSPSPNLKFDNYTVLLTSA